MSFAGRAGTVAERASPRTPEAVSVKATLGFAAARRTLSPRAGAGTGRKGRVAARRGAFPTGQRRDGAVGFPGTTVAKTGRIRGYGGRVCGAVELRRTQLPRRQVYKPDRKVDMPGTALLLEAV